MSDHPARYAADVASFAIIGGAMLDWLPHVVALLAAVWYGVLLYDRFRGKK